MRGGTRIRPGDRAHAPRGGRRARRLRRSARWPRPRAAAAASRRRGGVAAPRALPPAWPQASDMSHFAQALRKREEMSDTEARVMLCVFARGTRGGTCLFLSSVLVSGWLGVTWQVAAASGAGAARVAGITAVSRWPQRGGGVDVLPGNTSGSRARAREYRSSLNKGVCRTHAPKK